MPPDIRPARITPRYLGLLFLFLFVGIGCEATSTVVESAGDNGLVTPMEHDQTFTPAPDDDPPVTSEVSDDVIVTRTIIDPGVGASLNVNCPRPRGIPALAGIFDFQWLANSDDIVIIANGTAWLSSKYHLVNFTNILDAESPVELPNPSNPIMEYSPAPAPSGHQFAYMSGQSGDIAKGYRQNLYGMRGDVTIHVTDGKHEQVVRTYEPPNEVPVQMKWSPDGTKLAVRIIRAGRTSLDLIDLDTQGAYTLVDTIDVLSFNWHPSEQLIAVEGEAAAPEPLKGSVFDIYVVHVGTGQVRQLTTGKLCESEPQWSPDGETILFADAYARNRDIFIADVASGEARNITLSEDDHEYWPTWSPDGKTIAYIQTSEPNLVADLCIFEIDEGKRTCLTNTRDDEFFPRWSPDGHWIAYAVSNMSEFYLAAVEPSEGRRVTIATLP